jgi:hypothetical protein
MRITGLLLLLFLSFPLVGFSQSLHEVEDTAFRREAGRLIDSLTDPAFTAAIRYQRTRECYYDSGEPDTASLSGYRRLRGVCVNYVITDSCGQACYYQLKGVRLGEFALTFDQNHRIVELPDFGMLKKIAVVHKYCFISAETAVAVAKRHFKSASGTMQIPQLVVDLVSKRNYWLIERESGFRNGLLETIRIDALTQEVLEMASQSYKKGFWEALRAGIKRVF